MIFIETHTPRSLSAQLVRLLRNVVARNCNVMLLAGMVCLMGVSMTAYAAEQPMIPRLEHQPGFSDAINVKTDVTPAAIGDGVADDTAALQAAFKLMAVNGKSKTVYLPAGNYRITQSLDLGGAPRDGLIVGGTIIGDGNASRIFWDGNEGEPMIRSLGYTHSSYIGFIIDGQNKANAGVLHIARQYETDMLYRDMAFMNIKGIGISIGTPHKGHQTAEVLYDNCLFDHCDVGVSFIAFNDYDNTFNGCEFRDCGKGIVNLHGNMYVRNCHFERSTITDIQSRGEHGSSIRRTTSLNSNHFLIFGDPVSTMIVQDCHIQGWKEFAIKARNSLLMFDCTFTPTQESAGTPPLQEWRNVLILSNNKVVGGTELTSQLPDEKNRLYEIPPGKLGPSLTSASQSFLQTNRSMPSKIFNAKTEFGATANRNTDDTQAIQNTIDAAKAYGKDAIAYIPAGQYKVTQTLQLQGANYRLGGDGDSTKINWGGPEGGTILHVTDPQNLTVQNIAIGANAKTNNGNDILQTSTGQGPTSITYDRIFVLSPYYNPKKNETGDPHRRGLHFQKLGKQDTVRITMMRGNLHIDDSAAATILCNTSFNAGGIRVQGKSKDRSGFFGMLTKLGVGEMPTLWVMDSQNVVISDLYCEQDISILKLTGSPEDTPGRVTIQGAKFQINATSELASIEIDGYRGFLAMGPNQIYPQKPVARITATSSGPMDILLLGNFYYKSGFDMELGPNVTLHNLGNHGYGSPYGSRRKQLGDTDLNTASQHTAAALDDLRRLGQIDLQLNHPQIFKASNAQ